MFRVLICGVLPRSVGGINYQHMSSEAPAATRRLQIVARKEFSGMNKDLEFKRFKRKEMISFEEYKASPEINKLFGGDVDQIARAYDDYCSCRFTRWRQSKQGGNPARMV
jgi:hypothetical protein